MVSTATRAISWAIMFQIKLPAVSERGILIEEISVVGSPGNSPDGEIIDISAWTCIAVNTSIENVNPIQRQVKIFKNQIM